MNDVTDNKDLRRHPVDDRILTRESWKVFQIMAEFVEGFERLSSIAPSVSVFGSARTQPDNEYYKLAEAISRELSDAGFSVVSGGGPGIQCLWGRPRTHRSRQSHFVRSFT